MARCRLWRYHPNGDGNRRALPGTDRAMWTPCRNRVTDGRVGCDACYRALQLCPVVAVRTQTVRDSRTPPEVAEWFVDDADDQVAQLARMRSGVSLFDVAPATTSTTEPVPVSDDVAWAIPPASIPVPARGSTSSVYVPAGDGDLEPADPADTPDPLPLPLPAPDRAGEPS